MKKLVNIKITEGLVKKLWVGEVALCLGLSFIAIVVASVV